MCVYVKMGEKSYIYANNEGFSFYCNEECEGCLNAEWETESTPEEKAEAIRKALAVNNLQPKGIN